MRKSDTVNTDIVRQILRMSQKALGFTLAMIGVGYVGGLIAICASQDLSEPLRSFADVFTPVWQLEIGVYGIGSTLENIQKLKTQIESFSKTENG